MNFAVLGAGSWGTTLANLLAEKNFNVNIWAREPEVVSGINEKNRNPFFVNHLQLNNGLKAVNNIEEATENCDYILTAIPSGFLKQTIGEHKNSLKKAKAIINVAKGFERGTGKRLSQVILDVLEIEENSAEDMVASLSGPNLADEVARKKTGATVIACPNIEIAQTLQEFFHTEYFRIYSQNDRTGVELGGTLKNIFAIGAGIVDGLQLGDNAKAAYLTRSLHELVKLGLKLGGKPETFYGLAGLGDLIATTSSPLSRNHKLGLALAQGNTLENYNLTTNMVIEGVETAKIAAEWGKKLTVQLPITEELCRILFENKNSKEAISNLMGRTLKKETE